MLNELVVIERGTQHARIDTVLRHPDLKDARPIPTLLVQLDEKVQVVSVRPVPRHVKPWTLRDGQHNSFPFVQLKDPLWIFPQNPESEEKRRLAVDRKSNERRQALLDLADIAVLNVEAFSSWPGMSLVERLHERRQLLLRLKGTESNVVLATVKRFLTAFDRQRGGRPTEILQQLLERIIEEFKRSSQDDWIEVTAALLIGSYDSKKNQWQSSGALLFEAAGNDTSILDSRLIPHVSNALSCHRPQTDSKDNQTVGVCSLTGTEGQLLQGSFSQPNVRVLGQTYLFAKNRDIPANDRYGRFSTDAMPVGEETDRRLAAALVALTADERKNITWRPIPGEAPKQSDLLVAFVEAVLDAPVAESLAEEDFSDEASGESSKDHDSIAAFEKRTERMIQLVKAKVDTDVTKTPVQLSVFRKVDPANRKVVYASSLSLADLYQSAITWIEGERNVPPWITLPVLIKGQSKPQPMRTPHVAPLGLIAFSKQLYIRGGTERQEVIGLSAAEALAFFLDPIHAGRRRGIRVLRCLLSRRSVLLTEVAQVQHMPECWEHRSGIMKGLDRAEALRSITLLGVLLYKLTREKEVYMNQTAFKLGQLLAAADVVHAGYCADVRGGAVPPALLGNQVFTMAQNAPSKALAMLSRRWKPYDGWAKKTAREPGRIESMLASDNKHEQQRGWDIRKALRHAREMGPVAAELALSVGACRVDDAFRAELLLGYIAGFPKAQKQDVETQDQSQE